MPGANAAGLRQAAIYGHRKEKLVMLRYKVVETSTVTDEALEQILNEWSAMGWQLDGIHFAMRDGSRRPAMAFVLFTRREEQA